LKMGKIYFDLYEQIYSPLNLWWAYKAAARGKRYTLLFVTPKGGPILVLGWQIALTPKG
jgi:hypothetical protein